MQTNLLGFVRYAAKAFFAAAVAGLGALISALEALPDGASFGEISTLGWAIIGLAALTAFGGVFGLTNSPTR